MGRRTRIPRLVVLGFLVLVATGTVLLKLPASTQQGITWVDAAFVATSASSVTGLSTLDMPATFTAFGSVVIMVLMQIGGLGVMTVTTLAVLAIGRRVGFGDLLIVREQLESVDSIRNTLRLLGQIAAITFACEVVGAVVLAIAFARAGLDPGQSAFQGVFHAIMAFCNSGFVTLPEEDLTAYAGNWMIVGTLALLIVLGGLGFPVLVNLASYMRVRRLVLNSKVVLVTTAVLLVVGVLSVGLLEWTNARTLGGEPVGTRIAMAMFQGVTPRTAGFSTVDYTQMREPTLVVQTVLMFIGAAPTSTAGGVKVTTMAIVVLIIWAQLRGRSGVTLFWREVPQPVVLRALTLFALAIVLVLVGTVALMISDGLRLMLAVFEVTSAFGTVGLSLNVTPDLSTFGKVLISSNNVPGPGGPDNARPLALRAPGQPGVRVPQGGRGDRIGAPRDLSGTDLACPARPCGRPRRQRHRR